MAAYTFGPSNRNKSVQTIIDSSIRGILQNCIDYTTLHSGLQSTLNYNAIFFGWTKCSGHWGVEVSASVLYVKVLNRVPLTRLISALQLGLLQVTNSMTIIRIGD